MVQILPQRTNVGSEIGRSLGAGLAKGSETGINQGRLQSAFANLDPNGNFTEQLRAIAPTLLTTPGGAQALAELAPLMGTQANNQAIRKSIDERRAAQQASAQSGSAIQGQQQQVQGQNYRNPKAPNSPETPFPQRTAGPQPQPEMSQRQMEDYALDLMENSLLTGKPISYGDAINIAQNTNQQTRSSNAQILKEKQLIESAQEKAAEKMVTRAQNSGLIKDPEDKTIAEKLAIEAQNAPNDVDKWEYVRSNLKGFDNAKEAIKKGVGLVGEPISTYRKMFGNYKSAQQIIDSVQPHLDWFRKHGMYDEGKALLVNDLGLGNEQAHSAMFPMNDQQKAGLNGFSPNKVKPFIEIDDLSKQFPSKDKYGMKPDAFGEFKDKIASYLSKNPEVDLVGLRANLNQDKKYAWQDISEAIEQLIDERRFSPDLEQEKQFQTIQQSPMPGVGAYFEYLWSGKK